jgi:hypothetical protein
VLPTINVGEDKWLNQSANAMLGWPKQLRALPDGISRCGEPFTDK